MAHGTTMVLKVDLQCDRCCKKVKKVLCSFDQIQDQQYNEKESKVTIKVVCCDPQKMKQKILCRGKDVIKSIEIIVPKTKQDDKPAPTKEDAKQPPAKEDAKPPPQKRAAPPPPPAAGVPVPFVPCVPLYPVPVADTCFRRTCCQECREGRRGGPCFPTCCQECDGGRCQKCDGGRCQKCDCQKCDGGRCQKCDGGRCQKCDCQKCDGGRCQKCDGGCCQECAGGRCQKCDCQKCDGGCCQECAGGRSGGPCFPTCCQECYGGRSGGPCFHGHNYNFGGPPLCYDDQYNGSWGKSVLNYGSYGGKRGNYFQPSQEYCSEPASECQLM